MFWLWLALAVVLFDQVSKQLADHLLQYGQPVFILPVFDLTLMYNKGAAFSFLADQSGWQRWFFTLISAAVSIMLFVWISRLPRGTLWLPIALSLVLGGAIGNLIDRALFGHVIDFISVHWQNSYFPTFNIADSAITIGAVMMAMDVLREMKAESNAKSDPSNDEVK